MAPTHLKTSTFEVESVVTCFVSALFTEVASFPCGIFIVASSSFSVSALLVKQS